jgi:hypothetical protein
MMKAMLKTFYRNDKLKRVDVYEIEIGGVSNFTFHEETWFDYEREPYPHSYLGTSCGGLVGGYYESAEAAEADRIASTPWLRDVSPDKR